MSRELMEREFGRLKVKCGCQAKRKKGGRWSRLIIHFGVGTGGFFGRGDTLEGKVDVLDLVAVGEDLLEFGDEIGGDFDIVHAAGAAVMKMGVFLEVGAVAGGLTLEVDLADKAAGNEGFEAVVDSSEGDGGHALAGTGEDFVGGGVVALVEEDGKNVLALPGGAKAGAGEGFVEHGTGVAGKFHGVRNGWREKKLKAEAGVETICGIWSS
jgi:hypothetical protein